MKTKLIARSTLLSTIFTLLSTAKAQAIMMAPTEPLYKDLNYIIDTIIQLITFATLLSLILLFIFTKGKPVLHHLIAIAAPLIIIFLNSEVATHFGLFTTYTKFPLFTYPILLITGSILAILSTLAILIPSRRQKIYYALFLLSLVYILTIIHASWYNQQNYQRMIDSGWFKTP